VLKSWQLKHHNNFEVVPSDIPDTLPKPFTLGTDDPQMSATLATALYRPTETALTLGSEPGTLSFEYSDVSGLRARKTFHFQPDKKAYLLTVDASVDVGGKSRPIVLAWGPAIGLGYHPDGSTDQGRQVVHMIGDKIERLSASSIQSQAKYEGAFHFAGAEDQFFLSAVLPGSQPVSVEYQPVSLPVPGNTAGLMRTFFAYTVRANDTANLQFFMGPKDLDVLHAVDPQLVRVIDFGFFSWLVVPLLRTLKWLNSFIGNYGWSIVALTVLINVIIFPLRHRSMVSMRKMQALQPQVKAIQDRYKQYKVTDPERQKMNTEMMALYKQKGVSPASGCVPMLLTLPILFAFYNLLASAIELRGAPFVGWIHDLSLRDPMWITPILMGITMFWQQRMSPSTADPIQQKVFMFLPVIFTVMFLYAPAGLVLYWLVSNLMTIAQQYVTNRIIGAPPVPVRATPKR
jgi:YidC/Oxa1 family membrane protein insertase